MVAPPKTPLATIARWNEDIRAVLNDPAIKKRVETIGAIVKTGSSDELATFVQRETEKYNAVAKLTRLKASQ
jgi:tripartite-type tricarboxylate transporter receptor subunit TctC